LSRHNASGRRRAGVPVAPARPRDAHRRDRRRRAAEARGDVSFAGISQKVAITTAASGLLLSVALPTTAAAGNLDDGEIAAGRAGIEAPVTAAVRFDRSPVGGGVDAEVRLREIVTAGDGRVTPVSAEGSLSAPLKKLLPTSGFGHRISPLTGWSGELHSGQDFGATCGSGVRAAAAGTVVFAAWDATGAGNRVVIDHGGGLETTYNHLLSIEIAEGDTVDRGAPIARVGTTGASTGCHLHFEVLLEGQPVDPLGWL
jgi:murein DD-endopeptidase MepM/ murein hydrolase activator NlpD